MAATIIVNYEGKCCGIGLTLGVAAKATYVSVSRLL